MHLPGPAELYPLVYYNLDTEGIFNHETDYSKFISPVVPNFKKDTQMLRYLFSTHIFFRSHVHSDTRTSPALGHKGAAVDRN